MKKWIFIAIGIVLLIIVADNCFFTLAEDETAIVQRFGRVHSIYVKEHTPGLDAELAEDNDNIPVYVGTGLHFKIPFIDNVITYKSTLISYVTDTREVITSDKRRLRFDNNAQWRIENPLRFYKAYNNIAGARQRIDDILYSRMNERVGQMESTTLITNKDVVTEMLEELTAVVSRDCAAFGVSVVDIRIKRTDMPSENYESIYNNMNTERQRIAAGHRSEGEEESIKIRSGTDRQVITITSEAERDAEKLRGEGDAKAASTFNEAYGKNPEFFEFYNLLETYRQTVGKSSTLVIPLDSPFAKYLLGVPEAPPVTSPVTAPPVTE